MFIKSTLILVTIMLFGASALIAQNNTFDYTSEDENMSITFPASYSVTSDEDEAAKTVKASAENDGLTFIASYTIHDVALTNHAELAITSLDGFVETLEGTVVKKSNWNNSGNTGLQAIISFNDGQNNVDYRIIFNENVQYQIVIAGSGEGWDKKIANAYFKSFKIIKE